jgi:hypothetical protein
METTDKSFIAEVYSLIVKIEDLVKKYEYEDRVMSAIMIGIIDPVDIEDKSEEVNIKSVFSYNLDSLEELAIVHDLMTMQFSNEEDPDSLLGDLGISLN